MRLFKMMAAFCVAMTFGFPALAWEVGHKVGPVRLNPGTTICDTMEDATAAISAVRGGVVPATCGILGGWPVAILGVVAHTEFEGNTYVILRILFMPPTNLGVQYSFVVDPENTNA